MKPLPIIIALAVVAMGAVLYFYPGSLSTVSDVVVGTGNGGAPAGSVGSADNTGKASVEDGTAVIAGRARFVGKMPDFSSIILMVSNPETGKEIKRVSLGAEDGSYKFVLTEGEYVLDIVKGTGTSKHLPQRMYVGAGETFSLNFQLGQ